MESASNKNERQGMPSGTPGIRTGIIGGAGYTGGELLRLLLHHPGTIISFIHSRSHAGKPVYSVHSDLLGDTDLLFSDKLANDIDVLFICLGHGESKIFLTENTIPGHIKIIDLSNDFRLKKDAIYQSPATSHQPSATRNFVYGLPELNREQIQSADNIANPGCFATAIQLGLLPLAKAGLLNDIYTTGITGSTGAGQQFSATSHFSWRANNIQAYKTLTHQHLGEIYQSLNQLQESFINTASGDGGISFVPWRGDFTRGIFISSTLICDTGPEELTKLYSEYYKGHPFTHISQEPIFMKQVVNTNNAVIQLEKEGNKLVVHSAIDNLLKGASGQAIQNMNLLFGFAENTGLQLKPTGF